VSTLRLVLVRHGQTASNVVGSLDSKPPGPPLTELGQQQAAAVGELLAAQPVVAVYTSVAVRARQTAEPIAAAHGLPVQVVEGVHEVFVGDLECRTDQQALSTFRDVFRHWSVLGKPEFPMPGGESANALLTRYLPVVDMIRERHSDGVAVLVSHGAAIRLAACALAANIDPAIPNEHLVPNTGRVVLEADAHSATGWRCLEWAGLFLT
jgi:broad specificity phosphatase PhoE